MNIFRALSQTYIWTSRLLIGGHLLSLLVVSCEQLVRDVVILLGEFDHTCLVDLDWSVSPGLPSWKMINFGNRIRSFVNWEVETSGRLIGCTRLSSWIWNLDHRDLRLYSLLPCFLDKVETFISSEYIIQRIHQIDSILRIVVLAKREITFDVIHSFFRLWSFKVTRRLTFVHLYKRFSCVVTSFASSGLFSNSLLSSHVNVAMASSRL